MEQFYPFRQPGYFFINGIPGDIPLGQKPSDLTLKTFMENQRTTEDPADHFYGDVIEDSIGKMVRLFTVHPEIVLSRWK